MTTPAHQPQTYTLSEEQLCGLEIAPSKYLLKKRIEEIRATHTSAPAPISQIRCFYCGRICTPEFRGIFRGIATCPECVEKGEDTKEARAEAAKAEREQVLDELYKWICEDRESLHRMRIIPALILHSLVIEKIESLRAQQQGGVSE